MSVTKLVGIVVLCLSCGSARASECPEVPQLTGKRYLVAISDLHFGLGKQDGKWLASDDFRWPNALTGFLNRISQCSANNADVVIAGDALELWQPPKEIACAGVNADTSCTVAEALALTKIVAAQHGAALEAIGAFAAKGSNKVYFVPGNHDAALHCEVVWKVVSDAMKTTAGRVIRCGKSEALPCTPQGLWISPDKRVIVEHGHQGEDLNKFKVWPPVLKPDPETTRLERPWGQHFVQSLFNEQEDDYETIDNLFPETAGVKYRLLDRGIWKSIKDVARLVKFNVMATSATQKGAVLADGSFDQPYQWDMATARGLGYKLFLHALPQGDPFRVSVSGSDAQALQLQQELDAMIKDPAQFSEVELFALCNQVAIETELKFTCTPGQLSAALNGITANENKLLSVYLNQVLGQRPYGNAQVYIYGHTHKLKEEFNVTTNIRTMRVFNTGAFQRVVDDKGFLARATSANLSPQEALRKFKNEDLPPCYTAVVLAQGSSPIQANTLRWLMPEDGKGEFVVPNDKRCH
jgi:UDP-2,3-diacylglucosamine pyrophosphatase LpxH